MKHYIIFLIPIWTFRFPLGPRKRQVRIKVLIQCSLIYFKLSLELLLKDTPAEQMSADMQYRSSVLRLKKGLPSHYTTLLPFIDFLLLKAKKPT